MRASAIGLAALLLATALPAQPSGRSLTDLQTAARGGGAEAQFQLGEAYRTGSGSTLIDRDQAIVWLKRAADQGHLPARDALGMLLFTRGNRQEAMPLIEAAAARGDPRALYILATARFNGDYVSRDWPRAYAEMSRAAELGLPQARTSLDQMERYLLPADRAKADQLRATMAAVASPAGMPVAPPNAVVLPRASTPAMPAPVPAPERGEAPAPPPRPAIVAVAPPPPPPPRAPEPLPPRALPATVATPPAPPKPAPRVVAAAPKPAAPEPPKPTPKPAPKPAIVAGMWKVQLGAYSSRDRAETQWKTLGGKVDVLRGHPRLITPVGALFRLQATGFAGRAPAQAACARIAAAGAGCLVLQP